MKNLDSLIEEIRSQGRNGDTILAHINPQEVELLKALGGSGTTNPKTGLPEFFGISIGGYGVDVGGGGVSVKTPNTSISTNDLWNTAKNTVSGVVNFAKDHPLEAAALVAAGYYYAPEIGAWMTPEGSAIAGTEAGTTAGAATLTAEEVAAQTAAAQAAAEQLAAEQAAAIAAENAAWDAAAIDLANSASPVFATSAAAAGLTFSEALNAARAGLLINAITGDPLGLSDVSGGDQTFANSGYAVVPVPTEWKSPTYATSAAPIDLESIFSNQNMLGGTQWQDLPSQRNMSFNDIFAAGQQQTPMGTPVDINQIVGSILGQTATR